MERTLLALLLAAGYAAPPTSLDEAGVASVMAGKTPTAVLLGGGKEQLDTFNKLAHQFELTGLEFATVDCGAHPEACTARKVNPNDVAIKYWNGQGSFRRYSGEVEYEPIKDYITKKLQTGPEFQELRDRLTENHRQQQQQQQAAAASQERPPSREARPPVGFGPSRVSTPLSAAEQARRLSGLFGVATLLFGCFILYLWLRGPHVEAPGTLVLVGSATERDGLAVGRRALRTSSSATSRSAFGEVDSGRRALYPQVYRLDGSGVLTPVSRLALWNPTTLCASPRRDASGAYIIHIGSDVVEEAHEKSDVEARRRGYRATSVATCVGGRFLTELLGEVYSWL